MNITATIIDTTIAIGSTTLMHRRVRRLMRRSVAVAVTKDTSAGDEKMPMVRWAVRASTRNGGGATAHVPP